TPLVKPPTPPVMGKVGDALDELVEGTPSSPPPPAGGTIAAPLFKTVYRYDNIVRTPSSFDAQTFAFNIPPNALLREPMDYSGKRIQQQVDNQIASILRRKGLTKPRKQRILRY